MCAGSALGMLLAVFTPSACAQSGDAGLREEIEALKKKQAATEQELAELKETLAPVLERLPKPFRPTEVSLRGSPVRGQAQAKVTLVEFTDLQCPFCVRYYENTFPQIVKNYVDTGKVRYVSREFPLTNMHKEADKAAQAALCAGDQGKYWEMRDKVFRNRQKLSPEDLAGYAEEVGVDVLRWKSCLDHEVYAKKVQGDLEAGARLGVSGTPSFLIGLTDPERPDSFTARELLQGAYPYEEFQKRLDKLLD